MIVEIKTRAQMIEDAEKELRYFQKRIDNGTWKDEGYTDQEIQDNLDLCIKSVSYLKNEIPHSKYMEAYHRVYGKKNERVV